LSTWKLPPVFQWLSTLGNIDRDELIRTFNCGIGMTLVASQEDAQYCKEKLSTAGEEVFQIGNIMKKEDKQIVYKNSWKI
jgi:phosphoribosylformylglycinamidine cyclo-ligase